MIEAKELRKGNLLHSRDRDGDGDIVSVVSIDEVGINFYLSQAGLDYECLFEKTDKYDWFWVEPIPLTPEIFEKCGFEKGIFWDGGNGTYSIDVSVEHEECVLSIMENGEYFLHYNCYHDGSGGRAKIKYLHQLQNLYYSLTGEELEVDL